MSEIQCKVVVDGVRCPTVIDLPGASDKTNFICRHHPKSVQNAAAGNVRTPRPDHRFQEQQFDRDLIRGARPLGTSHIYRQGQAHNCKLTSEGRTDE